MTTTAGLITSALQQCAAAVRSQVINTAQRTANRIDPLDANSDQRLLEDSQTFTAAMHE